MTLPGRGRAARRCERTGFPAKRMTEVRGFPRSEHFPHVDRMAVASRLVRRILYRGDPGDGHPSRPAVARRLLRPTRGVAGGQPIPLLGLAPGGVCRATGVTPGAGALLPHRFTLACADESAIGGLFSVALSCGSPRLGVTQHPALWSPDVPRPGPRRARTRPSGRLATATILACGPRAPHRPTRPRRRPI